MTIRDSLRSGANQALPEQKNRKENRMTAGNPKKATYETGLRGEEIAEEYLRTLGYRLIESRHREKTGEIDLIMEDGTTVVFVEVKARFSMQEKGEGLRAVTPAKQRRIARTATLYLMKQGWLRREIRFDVVEINQDGIVHVPNAFQPGGIRF